MNSNWWDRSATASLRATLTGPWPSIPDLVLSDADALFAAVGQRRAAFTPEWSPGTDDPGVVLARALAAQLAIVGRQTNQLVDRLARELLNIGGSPDGPSVASAAIVEFVIDSAAPTSVPIPARGVLLGPVRDDGLASVFETVRPIQVQPLVLGALISQIGRSYIVNEANPGQPLGQPIDIAPFGPSPSPGNAIWFGFEGTSDAGSLSLHLSMAATGDRAEANVVEWAVLRSDGETPVVVSVDETEMFTRSGIVELLLPAGWEPMPPPTGAGTRVCRWLIARLISGRYETTPQIVRARINAARVEGVETRRDEPIETTEDPTADQGGAVRFWLSRTPVMRGSVTISIERAATADPFATETSPRADDESWTEVDSLSGVHGSGRFFVVDSTSGELSFPSDAPAFRRVTAKEYQVSGGIVEVPNGAPLTVQNAPAFVSSALTIAGSRGTPFESPESAVRSGPARLRSAGRAVTPSDYETEALRVPGTGIARVLAQPGTGFDGSPSPGTVRLVAVAAHPDATGRLVPPADALQLLASDLETRVVPIGVQTVAVPAEFMPVRIEAQVVLRKGTNPSEAGARCISAINDYLSPLPNASDAGFPFGGVVEHRAIVARLAGIEGVEQVDVLLVVNGQRQGPCEDAPLRSIALPHPLAHLVTVSEGARP